MQTKKGILEKNCKFKNGWSAITTNCAGYDVHDSERQCKAKIISNYLRHLCILYELYKSSNVFFESYWNCKPCNEWKMLIAKSQQYLRIEVQLHILYNSKPWILTSFTPLKNIFLFSSFKHKISGSCSKMTENLKDNLFTLRARI